MKTVLLLGVLSVTFSLAESQISTSSFNTGPYIQKSTKNVPLDGMSGWDMGGGFQMDGGVTKVMKGGMPSGSVKTMQMPAGGGGASFSYSSSGGGIQMSGDTMKQIQQMPGFEAYRNMGPEDFQKALMTNPDLMTKLQSIPGFSGSSGMTMSKMPSMSTGTMQTMPGSNGGAKTLSISDFLAMMKKDPNMQMQFLQIPGFKQEYINMKPSDFEQMMASNPDMFSKLMTMPVFSGGTSTTTITKTGTMQTMPGSNGGPKTLSISDFLAMMKKDPNMQMQFLQIPGFKQEYINMKPSDFEQMMASNPDMFSKLMTMPAFTGGTSTTTITKTGTMQTMPGSNGGPKTLSISDFLAMMKKDPNMQMQFLQIPGFKQEHINMKPSDFEQMLASNPDMFSKLMTMPAFTGGTSTTTITKTGTMQTVPGSNGGPNTLSIPDFLLMIKKNPDVQIQILQIPGFKKEYINMKPSDFEQILASNPDLFNQLLTMPAFTGGTRTTTITKMPTMKVDQFGQQPVPGSKNPTSTMFLIFQMALQKDPVLQQQFLQVPGCKIEYINMSPTDFEQTVMSSPDMFYFFVWFNFQQTIKTNPTVLIQFKKAPGFKIGITDVNPKEFTIFLKSSPDMLYFLLQTLGFEGNIDFTSQNSYNPSFKPTVGKVPSVPLYPGGSETPSETDESKMPDEMQEVAPSGSEDEPDTEESSSLPESEEPASVPDETDTDSVTTDEDSEDEPDTEESSSLPESEEPATVPDETQPEPETPDEDSVDELDTDESSTLPESEEPASVPDETQPEPETTDEESVDEPDTEESSSLPESEEPATVPDESEPEPETNDKDSVGDSDKVVSDSLPQSAEPPTVPDETEPEPETNDEDSVDDPDTEDSDSLSESEEPAPVPDDTEPGTETTDEDSVDNPDTDDSDSLSESEEPAPVPDDTETGTETTDEDSVDNPDTEDSDSLSESEEPATVPDETDSDSVTTDENSADEPDTEEPSSLPESEEPSSLPESEEPSSLPESEEPATVPDETQQTDSQPEGQVPIDEPVTDSDSPRVTDLQLILKEDPAMLEKFQQVPGFSIELLDLSPSDFQQIILSDPDMYCFFLWFSFPNLVKKYPGLLIQFQQAPGFKLGFTDVDPIEFTLFLKSNPDMLYLIQQAPGFEETPQFAPNSNVLMIPDTAPLLTGVFDLVPSVLPGVVPTVLPGVIPSVLPGVVDMGTIGYDPLQPVPVYDDGSDPFMNFQLIMKGDPTMLQLFQQVPGFRIEYLDLSPFDFQQIIMSNPDMFDFFVWFIFQQSIKMYPELLMQFQQAPDFELGSTDVEYTLFALFLKSHPEMLVVLQHAPGFERVPLIAPEPSVVVMQSQPSVVSGILDTVLQSVPIVSSVLPGVVDMGTIGYDPLQPVPVYDDGSDPFMNFQLIMKGDPTMLQLFQQVPGFRIEYLDLSPFDFQQIIMSNPDMFDFFVWFIFQQSIKMYPELLMQFQQAPDFELGSTDVEYTLFALFLKSHPEMLVVLQHAPGFERVPLIAPEPSVVVMQSQPSVVSGILDTVLQSVPIVSSVLPGVVDMGTIGYDPLQPVPVYDDGSDPFMNFQLIMKGDPTMLQLFQQVPGFRIEYLDLSPFDFQQIIMSNPDMFDFFVWFIFQQSIKMYPELLMQFQQAPDFKLGSTDVEYTLFALFLKSHPEMLVVLQHAPGFERVPLIAPEPSVVMTQPQPSLLSGIFSSVLPMDSGSTGLLSGIFGGSKKTSTQGILPVSGVTGSWYASFNPGSSPGLLGSLFGSSKPIASTFDPGMMTVMRPPSFYPGQNQILQSSPGIAQSSPEMLYSGYPSVSNAPAGSASMVDPGISSVFGRPMFSTGFYDPGFQMVYSESTMIPSGQTGQGMLSMSGSSVYPSGGMSSGFQTVGSSYPTMTDSGQSFASYSSGPISSQAPGGSMTSFLGDSGVAGNSFGTVTSMGSGGFQSLPQSSGLFRSGFARSSEPISRSRRSFA